MLPIEKELKKIKSGLYQTSDLVIRNVEAPDAELFVVYLDAMVNMMQLEDGVIAPILKSGLKDFSVDGLLGVMTSGVSVESCKIRKKVLSEISAGECVMLKDGAEEYLILKLKGYTVRQPTEPPTSAVLKGPREGFIEDIKTNMVLLRRRFKSGRLVFHSFNVGRYTATPVIVAFLEGITDKKLIKGIEERIQAIDIDGIVDSSYVAKFLEKRSYSIFRQNGTAEKPDIVAAKMLEGRVAVFVDGSPIAITLPFLLIEDFQDSQDYFKRVPRANLVRIIRLMALFFSTLLPAAFVALQMHQFQMIPLKLLISVINSINGIPFSPIVEMLIALVFFEVLGEASIRMPRYVGMAISIVGAIILGETAVKAGILSSLTVLITAMSGIGLYAIPDEVGTFSVIRIVLVVVAGSTGTFGMTLAVAALVSYAVSIEIYGSKYVSPFAPITLHDLEDTFVKVSLKDMIKRPKAIAGENKTRLKI